MLADSSLGCEVECEPSNNNSLFSSQFTAGSLLAPGPQNEESETVSFVLPGGKHEESVCVYYTVSLYLSPARSNIAK